MAIDWKHGRKITAILMKFGNYLKLIPEAVYNSGSRQGCLQAHLQPRHRQQGEPEKTDVGWTSCMIGSHL